MGNKRYPNNHQSDQNWETRGLHKRHRWMLDLFTIWSVEPRKVVRAGYLGRVNKNPPIHGPHFPSYHFIFKSNASHNICYMNRFLKMQIERKWVWFASLLKVTCNLLTSLIGETDSLIHSSLPACISASLNSTSWKHFHGLWTSESWKITFPV